MENKSKSSDKRLGNDFWKLRSKHGRDKLFDSPELLREAAFEYFEWCEENPLKEDKLFAYQGVITRDSISKMRAFTMAGLCLYLGCSESYFRTFKSTTKEGDSKGFLTVIEELEQIIKVQKFTGAAADLFNANIIARDLGLSDKVDNKNTNNNHNIEPITKEEIEEYRKKLEEDY